MKNQFCICLTILFVVLLSPFATLGQTTAFTYQGRLNDSSTAANGSYDFQFALFDALTAGTQQGTTQTVTGVTVSSGAFTVQLDFGSATFATGADRYLEIRVKQSAQPTYTPLAPRQRITDSPYAIRAVSAGTADTATTAADAQNLNGLPAGNFVQTGDARLTDARSPTASSSFYIQNQTAGTQAAGFLINGTGTANIINSATQYNIGGSRVLSAAGTNNLFAGINAGFSNTTGGSNSFFGRSAGQANTTGSNNTIIGQGADVSTGNLTFATAVGSGAVVSTSNTVVLGRSADTVNVPGNLTVTGTISGINGASITNLNASNIATGTLADARLSSNVATLSGAQTFTGAKTFSGGMSGNASGLTNLTAANITGQVGTANGGTGLATAGAAGNFLRSDGTTWASSAILAADVPSLDAGKITSGTFAAARIPNLDASIITSGTFNTARIPDLSATYIRNQLAQQTLSNFNISGSGTAGGTLSGNAVNSATQFNIGGSRILSASGSNNLFAGFNAGTANTTGSENSFVGTLAGGNNTTGVGNSFFGRNTGLLNNGNNNSFFGHNAGSGNTTGEQNTFVGGEAGLGTTTGINNSFFGTSAGDTNTTGSENTIIGHTADVGANNLTYATALGSGAVVSTSNTVVLGRSIDTVNVPGNLTIAGTLTATFNGSGITNLNASNIATGTLADARLSSNVATLSGAQTFTGAKTFSGGLNGNGSALTNLAAANITGQVGTANGGTGLATAGATGNFLRSLGGTWTTSTILAADVPDLNAGKITTGTFDTARIPSLDASIITSGTINTARLPDLSATYVRNQTTPQSSSNFNVSGDGTAAGTLQGNIIRAQTQFNIGGNRVLSLGVGGTFNLFAGVDAGVANTTGSSNSFFGLSAGQLNTTGNNNSFFGTSAGANNSTGASNSFFGQNAGVANNGSYNSFFGRTAGTANTTGDQNVFVGGEAGLSNTTGSSNSFVGLSAGDTNTTGGNNTIIGQGADVSTGNLTFATAVGSGAIVSASNTVVLGRAADTVNVPGNLNVTGTFTGNVSGAGITNLNASNITSGTLSNARLGVVGVANGGTGLSAAGAPGTFLRSNGTGLTSSALTAADIPAGSANYVQNTTTEQAGTNFNISGSGTAAGGLTGAFIDSTSGYNIGGTPVLRIRNTYGLFVGLNAGLSSTFGNFNSFIGATAGQNNTTGADNSFVGAEAGQLNNSGGSNSFFGRQAGLSNTGGSSNSFFGKSAGQANTTGSNNTIIGQGADVGANNLTFAAALGSGATVSNSNSVVLGRSADTVRIPGNLVVTGSVSKGSGSFRIDHPLDPANKYLYHSFVESPDMMNVYNGNVVTDASGEATVTLPAYFEALNRDFRYQLTAVGAPAPNLYIAGEVKNNSFKIAGGKPGMKVSWQVTGIRHDKFADDERIKTEVSKPQDERGQCAYAPACQNIKP